MNRYNHLNTNVNLPPPSSSSSSDADDSRANTNAATPSGNNTSMDPFLLDFGTSVNITEELHRELRVEIQDIVQRISSSETNVEKEKRISKSLQQDLSYAKVEMTNLARGTHDRLEDAEFHASFLNGLETSLKDTKLSKEDDKENSPLSSKNHLTKQQIAKNMAQYRKNIRKHLIEAASLQKKMKLFSSHTLESDLENVQQGNAFSKVEESNFFQQKKTLEKKLQTHQSQTGTHAQNIAEKTKLVNALHSEHAQALQEYTKSVSLAFTKMEDCRESLSQTRSRLSLVDNRICKCQEQLELYNKLSKQKASMDHLLQQERGQEAKSTHLMSELARQRDVSIQKKEETQKQLQRAQALMVDAQRETDANEKFFATKHTPAQAEILALCREKERIALETSKHHVGMIQVADTQNLLLKEKSEERNKLSQELLALQKTCKQQKEESIRFNSTKEETKTTLVTQQTEAQSLYEKLTLAHEIDQAQLAKQEAEQEADAKAEISRKRLEYEQVRSQADRQIQILAYGFEICENAKKMCHALNQEHL